MKRLKKLGFLLVVMSVGGLFIGCGGPSSTPATSTTPSESESATEEADAGDAAPDAED